MITTLKTRTLADKFVNDVRAGRRKKGRYVYMALVAGVAVLLLKTTLGPLFWLDAGGLVTSDSTIITMPYDSQVVGVAVTAGEAVRPGQLIANIHSQTVAQVIADLKAKYAATEARMVDLNMRYNVAKAVIRSADDRLTTADSSLHQATADRKVVSSVFYQSMVREHYDAQQQQASNEAIIASATTQLKVLNDAQAGALQSIRDVEARYNGGVVAAPEDGIIGDHVAQKGDILRPGDYIATLFTGQRYVLAYLPTDALYSVHVGEHVKVQSGYSDSDGVIARILPIAVQLPAEFQKTFSPRGRGQVAEIRLAHSTAFPLSNKVQVISYSYLPRSWETSLETAWTAVKRQADEVTHGVARLVGHV